MAGENPKCCICGEEIGGYGNNPAPLARTGRCCDRCNLEEVLPARLEAVGGKTPARLRAGEKPPGPAV